MRLRIRKASGAFEDAPMPNLEAGREVFLGLADRLVGGERLELLDESGAAVLTHVGPPLRAIRGLAKRWVDESEEEREAI